MKRYRAQSPRDLARSREGSTAVEFAICALALLLFVFGMIEMGRMLWTWQTLQAVAVETARCVAVGSSLCTNGQTYAVSLAGGRGIGGLTASNVTVNNSASCAGQSNFTQVSITFTYHTVMPAYIPTPSGGLKASGCFPNIPSS